MESIDRPFKRDTFIQLLRLGSASLHLDSRRPGVEVPAHLRGQAHLVLQYGYNLPIPIPDLEVDDSGVRATLSFSREPHRTVVPWAAVYVIAADDGRCVLYDEDIPAGVSVVAHQGPCKSADAAAPGPRRARTASPVAPPCAHGTGPAQEPPADDSGVLLKSLPADHGVTPPPDLAPRHRRPVLRLVK